MVDDESPVPGILVVKIERAFLFFQEFFDKSLDQSVIELFLEHTIINFRQLVWCFIVVLCDCTTLSNHFWNFFEHYVAFII